MFLKGKDEISFEFSLYDELTVSRFIQFKKRVFYLKKHNFDFNFYFPRSQLICDDGAIKYKKDALKQEKSFGMFLDICKVSTPTLVDQFVDSVVNQKIDYKAVNYVEINENLDPYECLYSNFRKNLEKQINCKNLDSIEFHPIKTNLSHSSTFQKRVDQDFVYLNFETSVINSPEEGKIMVKDGDITNYSNNIRGQTGNALDQKNLIINRSDHIINENNQTSYHGNCDSIYSFVQNVIDERTREDMINSEYCRKSGVINIRSEKVKNLSYTHEEIYKILNLKTENFSKMPQNPLKIAEASFSEVFKSCGLIYKIIPFNEWYNIEAFCKEVFILDNLKNESGVCKLRDRFLLQGSFTKEYLNAWQNYKNSENVHPSEYGCTQLYGVLVMEDCGMDLEKYKFKTYHEIVDFIDQLLSTVSILETKYKFEHRDMHWGNVMIKNSKIFIIDFNFSRIEIDKVVYTNLNEENWLFEGDDKVDIQFEVYKLMKESCKSDWLVFNAKSNLFWVRYLLKKLQSKISGLLTEHSRITAQKEIARMILKGDEYANCTDFYQWFQSIFLKTT